MLCDGAQVLIDLDMLSVSRHSCGMCCNPIGCVLHSYPCSMCWLFSHLHLAALYIHLLIDCYPCCYTIMKRPSHSGPPLPSGVGTLGNTAPWCQQWLPTCNGCIEWKKQHKACSANFIPYLSAFAAAAVITALSAASVAAATCCSCRSCMSCCACTCRTHSPPSRLRFTACRSTPTYQKTGASLRHWTSLAGDLLPVHETAVL